NHRGRQDCHTFQYSKLRSLTLWSFLSKECFRTITYLFRISPNIESLYVIINKSLANDGRPKYPYCDEVIVKNYRDEVCDAQLSEGVFVGAFLSMSSTPVVFKFWLIRTIVTIETLIFS
ncbi:hypothetical protein MKX01_021758, partial [Papaver californicum]